MLKFILQPPKPKRWASWDDTRCQRLLWARFTTATLDATLDATLEAILEATLEEATLDATPSSMPFTVG